MLAVLLVVSCGSEGTSPTLSQPVVSEPPASSTSTSPGDSVAAPTVPPSDPPEQPSTTLAQLDEWTGPWFEVSLADATSGLVSLTACCASNPPEPNDTYSMAWTDANGADNGLLTLTVILDGPEGFADGDYASERLDLAEGEAFLQWANDGTDAEDNRSLEVAWRRANGDVWKFMSSDLSPRRLIDLVEQVQPGSPLPALAPESGMQLTATVDSSGAGLVRSQEISVAGEYVSVSVRNDGRAFGMVVLGDEARPITIAGANGYVSTLRNGQIEAVWDAGDGWWATVAIGSELASRADEILGSIVSTGAALPASEQRYDFSIELPVGSIHTGPDDLFIVHDDGDLYWHRDILAENPTDPIRLADFGDPRPPVTEGSGPNGVDAIAGVVNGSLIYGDCCEPISGNLLAATGPDSERTLLGAGYSPTLSSDQQFLATANDYADRGHRHRGGCR